MMQKNLTWLEITICCNLRLPMHCSQRIRYFHPLPLPLRGRISITTFFFSGTTVKFQETKFSALGCALISGILAIQPFSSFIYKDRSWIEIYDNNMYCFKEVCSLFIRLRTKGDYVFEYMYVCIFLWHALELKPLVIFLC